MLQRAKQKPLNAHYVLTEKTVGLLCALTGIRQRLPLEGEKSVSNCHVQSLHRTILLSDTDALSGTFQKVLGLPPS